MDYVQSYQSTGRSPVDLTSAVDNKYQLENCEILFEHSLLYLWRAQNFGLMAKRSLVKKIKRVQGKERGYKTKHWTSDKSGEEERQEVNTKGNSRRRQTGSKHSSEQQKKTDRQEVNTTGNSRRRQTGSKH